MLGLLRPLLAAALAAAAAALPASRSASISTLGYLQVSAGHSVTGYVSRSQNSYGEYKGVSPDTDHSDVSHRLIVSFDLSANGSTNLLASNGPDNDYPFFGAFAGDQGSDLGNNGNYMILVGTGQSAPGAAASYVGNTFTDSTNTLRKAASAIWRVNTTSGAVTAAWVNDDGSVVLPTYIGYVDSGFVLAGNKSAFEATWEDSVEWVTFKFTTS